MQLPKAFSSGLSHFAEDSGEMPLTVENCRTIAVSFHNALRIICIHSSANAGVLLSWEVLFETIQARA